MIPLILWPSSRLDVSGLCVPICKVPGTAHAVATTDSHSSTPLFTKTDTLNAATLNAVSLSAVAPNPDAPNTDSLKR